MDWNRIEDRQQHGNTKDRARSKIGSWLMRRERTPVLRNVIAVTALTIAQFTAFPFIAMVAANSAHQAEEVTAPHSDNVTVVYKTQDGRSLVTM